MRTQLLSVMIHLLFLGSLLTTLMWYTLNDRIMKYYRQEPKMKGAARKSCKNCGEHIEKALKIYSKAWKKQEDYYQNFSSLVRSKCNGSETAIITQMNTPLGSNVTFDGERFRTVQVQQEMFDRFLKVNPLSKKKWRTCAVVGNGGILGNSNCGETIDSAEFVFRCNLPPLTDEYKKDVGVKTNLVTANPSIFVHKFEALNGHRLPLMEKLRSYGNSLFLFPPFTFAKNTAVCLRALYTIEDFGGPVQPAFINPHYLHSVHLFWRTQGLKALRPSIGLTMTSLALELCENVDLYGFWPFAVHPYNFHELTTHYYDNQKVTFYHAMPVEFKLLLQLHSQGVIRLNLGDCETDYS